MLKLPFASKKLTILNHFTFDIAENLVAKKFQNSRGNNFLLDFSQSIEHSQGGKIHLG